MSKDIRNINLIFAAAGFSMSILGLIHTLVGRFVEKRTKSFFISLFTVLNIYVLSVLIRELTYDHICRYNCIGCQTVKTEEQKKERVDNA